MLHKETLISLLLLLSACLGLIVSAKVDTTASLQPSLSMNDDGCNAWVDSVYATMSERQRIAQLFVPRLDIDNDASGRQQLKRMVESGIGGFLLGKGTIDSYNSLITLAQSEAKIPLLVTLDGEWGLAMRVAGTPRFPHNVALGAVQDAGLMYDYGAEVARECRAMGIQVDFAPVLDVNSNPSNPVIGYRSLGEDPNRVATLGVAFSKGMEDGGVMSVAKHFPGHGDTSTDSHKTLPVVDHSWQHLNSVDLLPFKSYIDAGLSGIMVGHLFVPALDSSGTPASLSSKITTGLLRDKLGFKGLVWTDALAMKGANSTENNCVRALRAGANVLLGSGAPLADIDAVVKAVESGVISRDIIAQRCKKILAYKYALGLTHRPIPRSTEEVGALINAPEAHAVNRRLSAAAITCAYNRDGLLPVGNLRQRDIAVVSIGKGADSPFSEFCRKYADCTLYGAKDSRLSSSQIHDILRHDLVIVGVFSDSRDARTSFAALNGCKDVVPVFFLNPYKISGFSPSLVHHSVLVCAFDDTPLLEEYAAQGVFGGIPMTGRFPVNVKGVARVGEGVDVAKSRLGFSAPSSVGMSDGISAVIDSMVNVAMTKGAFPGCQVVVAKNGYIVVDKAFGVSTKGEGGFPVTTSTLYDVASMTKATATTAGVMLAVDEGLVSLDNRVADFIELPDSLPVGDISVRQLLYHESGLPSNINMFALVTDTATYTGPLTSRSNAEPYTLKIENGLWGNSEAQLRTDLVGTRPSRDFDLKIGEGLYVGQCTLDTIMSRICCLTPSKPSFRYSDLNFCLLAAILESATEETLDQWVDMGIFRPLGAYNTLFRPADSLPLSRIAPTEHDRFLRKQTMHGYVHDETASFSGGVQGNAGLFSTAEDVAKYGQLLLNGGRYGDCSIIEPATVKDFTTVRSPSGRMAGFDTLRKVNGAGDSTFGHTGFTGTCFWVDPSNELVFVFLSNRVNPSRDNRAFADSNIRNRLLSAVYRSIL